MSHSTIALVTPCKGRLAHLQRTLPAMLATGCSVVVVDYSCPERAGNWALAAHADAARAGQLSVTHVATHGPRFSKSRAHNAGGRAACARGASLLAFVDCDTILQPGLGAWLTEHVDEEHFGVFEPRPGLRDLYGFLAITRRMFRQYGGYNETFYNWGMEDLEHRLRLRLSHGIGYRLAPTTLAQPIAHGDALRTRYYSEQRIERSNRRNFGEVRRLVKAWTGQDLHELPRDDLRPLLGLHH